MIPCIFYDKVGLEKSKAKEETHPGFTTESRVDNIKQ